MSDFDFNFEQPIELKETPPEKNNISFEETIRIIYLNETGENVNSVTINDLLKRCLEYQKVPSKFKNLRSKKIQSIDDVKSIGEILANTAKKQKILYNKLLKTIEKGVSESKAEYTQNVNYLEDIYIKCAKYNLLYKDKHHYNSESITAYQLFVEGLLYKEVPESFKNKVILMKDLKLFIEKHIVSCCRSPVLVVFCEVLNINISLLRIQTRALFMIMKLLTSQFGTMTYRHERYYANNKYRVDMLIEETGDIYEIDEPAHNTKSYLADETIGRDSFFKTIGKNSCLEFLDKS